MSLIMKLANYKLRQNIVPTKNLKLFQLLNRRFATACNEMPKQNSGLALGLYENGKVSDDINLTISGEEFDNKLVRKPTVVFALLKSSNNFLALTEYSSLQCAQSRSTRDTTRNNQSEDFI